MAAPNECVPFKEPGSAISGFTTAVVVGKTFAAISAARTGGGTQGLGTDLHDVYSVATCAAAKKPLGVFKHDAISGAMVGLHTGHGIIVPVTSGAAIAAGAEVEVDATGRAVTLAAGRPAGMCLDTVAGANVDAEILLY